MNRNDNPYLDRRNIGNLVNGYLNYTPIEILIPELSN
jgi:hypothetical protein